jgi:hypothetical protein
MPPPHVRADDVGMHSFVTPLLDRELLAGADPQRDPALDRRAQRVCARRKREKLAGALEAVVAQAERGRGGLSSSVPAPTDEVLGARTPLLDLARRLRSDGPVDPQGVLLTRRLLSDPASALNSRSGAASLIAALRSVNAALNPR